MSQQNTQESEAQMLDAEEIAEYLRQNPDFFNQHPDVLAELNLSHNYEGAISLIEHQVKILRTQNRKLKQQLDELITIARDNDTLSDRIHRLTLALMDAETINEAYIALDDILRGDFQADAVAVKLFIDTDIADIEPDNELMQTVFVHMNDPRMDEYKTILTQDKPLCGPLKPEQIKYIFGEDAGADIESTALIPIGGDSCTNLDCPFLGMIAIGSEDPDRFHPNMGTLFLNNLGDIVSRTVKAHLVLKSNQE